MKNYEAPNYLDLQYFQILHEQKFLSTEITLYKNNSKSSLIPAWIKSIRVYELNQFEIKIALWRAS